MPAIGCRRRYSGPWCSHDAAAIHADLFSGVEGPDLPNRWMHDAQRIANARRYLRAVQDYAADPAKFLTGRLKIVNGHAERVFPSLAPALQTLDALEADTIAASPLGPALQSITSQIRPLLESLDQELERGRTSPLTGPITPNPDRHHPLRWFHEQSIEALRLQLEMVDLLAGETW